MYTTVIVTLEWSFNMGTPHTIDPLRYMRQITFVGRFYGFLFCGTGVAAYYVPHGLIGAICLAVCLGSLLGYLACIINLTYKALALKIDCLLEEKDGA
jgi:hypothetical protein